jgi:HAD superfamily hydrolase (TIGR01549 family)
MKNDHILEKLKARSFRAIIFDFDGTILDIKKALEQSIEEVYKEKGIATDMESTIQEIGAVLESIQGNPIPKILLQSFDVFKYISSLEKLTFLKKLRIAMKIFSKYQIYSKEAELFAGIKTLLEYLNKNIDLFIVSHNQTKSVLEHLQKEEIEKYFKGIYGADMLPALKPSSEAFSPVLKQYKITKTQDFLIIGDMPSDIQAGQEAGLCTLAVASGISKKDILTQYQPDLLVDSILELLTLLGINEGRFSNSNIQKRDKLKIKS